MYPWYSRHVSALILGHHQVNFFKLPNSSGLTEISTRSRKIIFLGSKQRLVSRADNLLLADFLDNVGPLTSQNPTGLHGL
jgi:hypothetical protein